MRLGGASLRTWCVDERGLTGAEKALLLCLALAVILAVGNLVKGGATGAAGKAAAALSSGGGLGAEAPKAE